MFSPFVTYSALAAYYAEALYDAITKAGLQK